MKGPGSPPADSRSVSERVVEAVAEAEGVHPIELSTPLYDAVDPDALNAMFRSAHTSVVVTFRFCGHDVTVSGDETVSLDHAGVSTSSEGRGSMASASGDAGDRNRS